MNSGEIDNTNFEWRCDQTLKLQMQCDFHHKINHVKGSAQLSEYTTYLVTPMG